ncbi:hypothetical protein GYMLUDRAFT_37892 [Collybiopsis luxurians FD-317 M1]|nr:hypothetical protein GYMLUDRAFT_37892 [Collybiopsis luxurians FD-317 M1]
MQNHSGSELELTDDQVEEPGTLSVGTRATEALTAFNNASNFTMYNPSFILHHGNTQKTMHYRKKPKLSKGINKRKNLEFDFATIPPHEIDSGRVICVRNGSRFYAATRECKPSMTSNVVVQEFEGSSRKQQWERTLRWTPHSLNPHLLRLVGISPPSISDQGPCYVVYKGARSMNPRHLIASLLGKSDRERLAGVGCQVVYGVVSALDYLSKTTTILRLADIGFENFEVFSDEDGSSTVCFTPAPAGIGPTETDMCDIAVCDSLIGKLFSDANHILHREKLNRFDQDVVHDTVEVDNHASSGSQATSRSEGMGADEETAKSLDSSLCRREIIWTSRNFDMTLLEMSESYGNLLHLRLPLRGKSNPNAIHLPQRSGKRWSEVQHECRGYRREEITLTPDAFRNEVLVFGNPSIHEHCGLCGEIVQVRSSQISSAMELSYISPSNTDADSGLPEVQNQAHTSVLEPTQTFSRDSSVNILSHRPLAGEGDPWAIKNNEEARFSREDYYSIPPLGHPEHMPPPPTQFSEQDQLYWRQMFENMGWSSSDGFEVIS